MIRIIVSYILYVGVLVICWQMARFAEFYNSKKCIWAIIVILTLFAGLRHYSVGIDTISYVNHFDLIKKGEFAYAYGLEESFKYICYGFLKIIPNNTALLTFLYLIINGLIIWRMWDFRRVSAFGTMVACYYMGFFLLSLNIMRQFCAIAIVFYFTRYLTRHKTILYLIGVLLASLFHTSGLLGIAFLTINLLRWKQLKKKEKVFYIGILTLVPVLITYLVAQMIRYEGDLLFGGYNGGIMVPIKIAFYIFTLLLVYAFYGSVNHFADWAFMEGDNKTEVYMAQIYYGAGLLMLFLSYMFSALNRAGLYFSIFEAVYLGTLVRTKHQFHRHVFGICAIAIVGYGFVMAMVGNEQGTMPYLFVWQ